MELDDRQIDKVLKQFGREGIAAIMDDDFGDVARDDEAIHVAEFQPARFHAELGLPSADDQMLRDAATSVRQPPGTASRSKSRNIRGQP